MAAISHDRADHDDRRGARDGCHRVVRPGRSTPLEGRHSVRQRRARRAARAQPAHSPNLPHDRRLHVPLVARAAAGRRALGVHSWSLGLEIGRQPDRGHARSLQLLRLGLVHRHGDVGAAARPGTAAILSRFFSGHAAISATGAGLTCANHTRIALWGNRVADISACVLASLNALTTATTRVVADRHYASDVILGAGVGFWFRLLGSGAAPLRLPGQSRRISFVPDPNCGPGCIGMRGSFLVRSGEGAQRAQRDATLLGAGRARRGFHRQTVTHGPHIAESSAGSSSGVRSPSALARLKRSVSANSPARRVSISASRIGWLSSLQTSAPCTNKQPSGRSGSPAASA